MFLTFTTALLAVFAATPTFAQYVVISNSGATYADVPDTSHWPSTPTKTVSAPGAMDDAGNFFVFKNTNEIWRWNNNNEMWDYQGSHNFHRVFSPPTSLTDNGGFHFIGKDYGGKDTFAGWNPYTGFSQSAAPNGEGLGFPSEPLFPGRVLVVNGDNAYNTKLMDRANKWGSNRWETFPSPPNNANLQNKQKPVIISEGKAFLTTWGGELMEMYWYNNRWNWNDHGLCGSRNGIKKVGAPMGGSKVFAVCQDGTLRERYYADRKWSWSNHRKPFNYFDVDTVPATIRTGKLFVTGSYGSRRVLLELYWHPSRGTWQWRYHGTPPLGTNLKSGVDVITRPGQDRVVVQDTNDDLHMLEWNGSAWEWKYLGKP